MDDWKKKFNINIFSYFVRDGYFILFIRFNFFWFKTCKTSKEKYNELKKNTSLIEGVNDVLKERNKQKTNDDKNSYIVNYIVLFFFKIIFFLIILMSLLITWDFQY